MMLIIASFFLYQVLGCARPGGSPGPVDQSAFNKSPETGDVSDIGKHPWLAFILYQNAYVCVGTIINFETILTTAQCTRNATNDLSVIARGVTYQVIELKRHEKYQEFDGVTIHDVALIRVSPRFKYGRSLRTIPLLTNEYKDIAPNTVVSVAGWITTNEHEKASILRNASLSIVDIAKCKKVCNVTNTEGQICLGTFDRVVCQGNAGSPVVVDGVQIGIVSSNLNCVYPWEPKLYINVAYYYEWI